MVGRSPTPQLPEREPCPTAPACIECKPCTPVTCPQCTICPANQMAKASPLSSYLQIFVENALKPTRDSDCHFITLFSIAITLRAKNILELGTRTGTTAIPLIFASTLIGGMVTSVDISDANFAPEIKSLSPEMAKHWTFHKSDALAHLRGQPQNFIWDLVFVDDWHTREHVKQELQLLAPHLNTNSLVLLHDLMSQTFPKYNYNMHRGGEFANGGVYYGLIEFLNNSTELWEWATFPVCHGITILRKRDPEPL